MIYKIEFKKTEYPEDPDFILVRSTDLAELQIALVRAARRWNRDRIAIGILLVINASLWWLV